MVIGEANVELEQICCESSSTGVARHLWAQHLKRSFARCSLCHCATLLSTGLAESSNPPRQGLTGARIAENYSVGRAGIQAISQQTPGKRGVIAELQFRFKMLCLHSLVCLRRYFHLEYLH